jgi:hypothetical protein
MGGGYRFNFGSMDLRRVITSLIETEEKKDRANIFEGIFALYRILLYFSRIKISALLFSNLPLSVLLSATGFDSPNPTVDMSAFLHAPLSIR